MAHVLLALVASPCFILGGPFVSASVASVCLAFVAGLRFGLGGWSVFQPHCVLASVAGSCFGLSDQSVFQPRWLLCVILCLAFVACLCFGLGGQCVSASVAGVFQPWWPMCIILHLNLILIVYICYKSLL